MRILVTGAAGFIGRHLLRELTEHGALGGREITEIVAADLVPVEGGPRLVAATGGICNGGFLDGLFAGGGSTRCSTWRPR